MHARIKLMQHTFYDVKHTGQGTWRADSAVRHCPPPLPTMCGGGGHALPHLQTTGIA